MSNDATDDGREPIRDRLGCEDGPEPGVPPKHLGDPEGILHVAADTVVTGIKLNERPGISRRIIFRPSIHPGQQWGTGQLEDVSDLIWPNGRPPIFRPRAFVSPSLGYHSQTRRIAREEARTEGADVETWEEEATEVWEQQAKHALRRWIIVEEPGYRASQRKWYEVRYVDMD